MLNKTGTTTLVDRSLLGNKALKMKTTEILSKQKELWIGRIREKKTTNHIIELKEELYPVHQYPYSASKDLERCILITLARRSKLV